MRVTSYNRRIEHADDIAALLARGRGCGGACNRPPDDIDLIVNEACMQRGIAFICGGLSYTQVCTGRSTGPERVPAVPGNLPCRPGSRRRRRPERLARRHRAERPNRATGPIAQMLGALVAMEALRYLTGLVPPLSPGTYQLVDFASDCAISSDAWPADRDCPLCTSARALRAVQTGSRRQVDARAAVSA